MKCAHVSKQRLLYTPLCVTYNAKQTILLPGLLCAHYSLRKILLSCSIFAIVLWRKLLDSIAYREAALVSGEDHSVRRPWPSTELSSPVLLKSLTQLLLSIHPC